MSKLGLWWGLSIQSRKSMRLKFTEQLCLMTMKNDANFEEELTCRFKIDMGNLMNFLIQALKCLENFHFKGFFWTKYILFELKQYRGVIFHDTKEWCKIWGKTDLLFEKWHKKFGEFSPEHLKVSKLGLWWDLFVQSRKMYKFKIYKGVMCHNNEEWYKNLWGNDLSVKSWHGEFHEFWPKHSIV